MGQRPCTLPSRYFRFESVPLGCLGALIALAAVASPTRADEKSDTQKESTVSVGKCATVTGALLQKQDDKSWKLVKPGDEVTSGAILMALPGSRAEIDGKAGRAGLVLAGNLPELSFIPLLESAVVLRKPAAEVDLEFTLDRGRVIVVNKKTQGAVTARVHFQDQAWDLHLTRPGTEVALEHVARWVARPSSVENPKKTEKPDASVLLYALKGELRVLVNGSELSMKAPPGPALLQWRPGQGTSGPTRLKDLPPWANPATSPAVARAVRERVEKLGKALETGSVNEGLRETQQSTDSAVRVLGVYCLGAIDDLSSVVSALEDKKHRDVRLTTIDELRHWLGRRAGNMPALFKALRAAGFSAAHARIAINLLQPFSPEQVARPETFALLIDYLKHQRLAIRELAYWHLIFFAKEEGRTIPYDPAADAAKLEAAYTQWKKALPDGELPRKAVLPRPIKKD